MTSAVKGIAIPKRFSSFADHVGNFKGAIACYNLEMKKATFAGWLSGFNSGSNETVFRQVICSKSTRFVKRRVESGQMQRMRVPSSS